MSPVRTSLEDLDGSRVLRLTLDRASSANALDGETVDRLLDALDLADERGAALVVLESSARTFCGGLDLAGLEQETDAGLLLRLVRIQLLLERFATVSATTVACVRGAAVGAGADLVLATDVRLALAGASLRFPGSGFGAVLGTGRLAAETSPSYAAELALTARRLDDATAAERGLWRVVDSPEAMVRAVADLAASAQAVPPGTARRLRDATSTAPAGDPLGHLVRSLAARPGLRDRVRQHRDRALRSRTPVPDPVPGPEEDL